MDREKIRQLLIDLQANQIDVEEALTRLQSIPYEDLGFARLDLHRDLRQGLPEVVFCKNKTPDQVVSIIHKLCEHHTRVLGTRASPEIAEVVRAEFPEVIYNPTSKLLKVSEEEIPPPPKDGPFVLIVTGGTSDQPIAEEAAQTLEFLGIRVERAYDVGVSGVHRLLDEYQLLMDADVIISIAGMEGALTSVVGGLVSAPIIGVPTSVGYGANFQGIAALLTMLNACVPGIAVVNIDNGFGAAVFARRIMRRLHT